MFFFFWILILESSQSAREISSLSVYLSVISIIIYFYLSIHLFNAFLHVNFYSFKSHLSFFSWGIEQFFIYL